MPPLERPADRSLHIQRALGGFDTYNRWIADLVAAHLGPRIIDAGCSVGNITKQLADRRSVLAIDRDPKCLTLLRASWPGPACLSTVCADLRDLPLDIGCSFDSAVCLNVLEHIDSDLRVLRGLGRCLRPRGTLVLIVPAFPLLYGSMDRWDGHARRYRRSQARAVVEEAGFEVRSAHYFNLPGFFAWLMAGKILRARTLAVPRLSRLDPLLGLFQRIERRIRPPFGQSLLLVARRPRPHRPAPLSVSL